MNNYQKYINTLISNKTALHNLPTFQEFKQYKYQVKNGINDKFTFSLEKTGKKERLIIWNEKDIFATLTVPRFSKFDLLYYTMLHTKILI